MICDPQSLVGCEFIAENFLYLQTGLIGLLLLGGFYFYFVDKDE
jgi:hypothetical protein